MVVFLHHTIIFVYDYVFAYTVMNDYVYIYNYVCIWCFAGPFDWNSALMLVRMIIY